jgi:hypothetical protein
MKVHEPERQAFARDRQEYERGKSEMLSEIARLEAELDHEKEEAARTVATRTAERDQAREELQGAKVAIAAAEGALAEARKQLELEQERNRELSERVIAEAAKAQALGEKLAELQKERSR